ncbi:peptidase, M48 family domain protein, partial [Vibrio parahaemolyticus V-223/04]
MSHMMFGQSKLSGFSGLFATHPPLDERIRRIEPNWDGSYAQHSHAQNTAFDNE